MLGLYIYIFIIGHKSGNMLGIINTIIFIDKSLQIYISLPVKSHITLDLQWYEKWYKPTDQHANIIFCFYNDNIYFLRQKRP